MSTKRTISDFSKNVLSEILSVEKKIYLCIGTDTHSWDSMGPILGSMLQDEDILCIGDLNSPVHSKNIQRAREKLEKEYKGYKVVAIDIGLINDMERHKTVCIRKNGLNPGAGVGREIPIIGDYSIVYRIHDTDLWNNKIRNPYLAATTIKNIILGGLNND